MRHENFAARRAYGLLCALALAAAAQTTHAEQDLAFVRPEYYQSLPAKFPSAPFKVGPYQEFPSPDPATFRSLVVPTHAGLPRIGAVDNYLLGNLSRQAEFGPTRQERTAVRNRLRDDAFMYLHLLSLQYMEAHLSPEKLKEEKELSPGDIRYYNYNDIYTPRAHVSDLAHALTTDKAYLYYFCKNPGDCIPGINRSPNDQAFGRYMTAWGGDMLDPFRVRARYHEFVDKQVPVLLRWSRSLPSDVYVVCRTSLKTYDFARGGYPLNISFPAGEQGYEKVMLYWEDDKSEVRVAANGRTADVLLAMAPGPAEALLEDLKKESGRPAPVILAVMKARFRGLSALVPGLVRGNQYVYDLVEPSVTLYRDEALTQKIATLPLTKR